MLDRIDKERLARTFVRLCEIDSPSRREGNVAKYLKKRLAELGAVRIVEDQSATATGSESGNLIANFNSNGSTEKPIFFVCHMDTVEPGCGVEVERNGDTFTSRGDTVLGGDDKSGIAALLEVMQVVAENNLPCRPVELVFTTCEEIGLLGAKALDYQLMEAEFGYALDSSGIDKLIVGAPASKRLKIVVNGVAAHAGLQPEEGVSAFVLAAQAITKLSFGRLDDQSSANLGLIQGGVATNIIPDRVVIEGEVRSHSEEKLASHTDTIQKTFQQVVEEWPKRKMNGKVLPGVDVEVWEEYPLMSFAENDPVVTRVRQAGERLGKSLEFKVAGGGSDANVINSYGLPTAIIATGMTKVHTTNESLDLADLVSLIELIYELIRGS